VNLLVLGKIIISTEELSTLGLGALERFLVCVDRADVTFEMFASAESLSTILSLTNIVAVQRPA